MARNRTKRGAPKDARGWCWWYCRRSSGLSAHCEAEHLLVLLLADQLPPSKATFDIRHWLSLLDSAHTFKRLTRQTTSTSQRIHTSMIAMQATLPSPQRSRASSGTKSPLSLDLSDLPPLVEPSPPSNTLIITVGMPCRTEYIT